MKIKIGNDIKIVCTLTDNGTSIDLSKIVDLNVVLTLNDNKYNNPTTTSIGCYYYELYKFNLHWFKYNANYTINTDNIYVYFPAIDLLFTGSYSINISYKIQSIVDSVTTYTNYSIDSDNIFILVKNTESSTSTIGLNISINDTIEATSISLDSSSGIMYIGNTKQLVATILPSNSTDKIITWSSSNTSIGTISSTGLITAISIGVCTITAVTSNNLSASYALTVLLIPTGSVFPYTFPLILS